MKIQTMEKRLFTRSLMRFPFFIFWFIAIWGIPVFSKAEAAKNIIVMIPDGCSFEQYTLVRWYKGAPLAMDAILVGAVKTHVADSVVADSAPAASVYATGVRTSDKFISVAPKTEGLLPHLKISGHEPYKPLATVLEAAKLTGRAVGVVSTSRVTHATPAAYIAHVSDRKLEDDIMEQAVYQGIDVVFGGGGRHLLGKASGIQNPYNEKWKEDPHTLQWADKGTRRDNENLIAVLRGKGYTLISTRNELMRLDKGPVFGMFALSHMAAEVDREQIAATEPSLSEMTRKAIEILSKDPDGFFLMVEGSQVDWANHANDPAHLISDLLIFDESVRIALDFARLNGDTLLLVLPDHNTGGMSIGNWATSRNYSKMKPDDLVGPLRKMKASSLLLFKKLQGDPTPGRVIEIIRSDWGLDITMKDAQKILKKMAEYREDPYYAFGEVLSPKYLSIGWSTHGHCGGDVPLGAFGPNRPSGLLDAPEIAQVVAEALGVNLEVLTRRLFTDASAEFGAENVTIDSSDPGNSVIRIRHGSEVFLLSVNKNLLKTGDRVYPLEGVTILIPETQKAYIPRQAVKKIKGKRRL